MYTELCRERNSTDQEEEGVDRIDGQHEHRVDGETLVGGGREQINEREHGEDGEEHAVVDDGWVAGERVMDHVSSQDQDEKRP